MFISTLYNVFADRFGDFTQILLAVFRLAIYMTLEKSTKSTRSNCLNYLLGEV